MEKMAAYLSSAHGIPKHHITAKPPNKKKGSSGGEGSRKK